MYNALLLAELTFSSMTETRARNGRGSAGQAEGTAGPATKGMANPASDPRFFSRLNLNLLRVLVAIARFRSVTEAGRHLSLSQPATSNALARLREAFADPLFVRAPGALMPTPLTTRIAPLVARHLDELEATLTEPNGFDPALSTKEWRMSLSDLGEIVFLSAIVEAIRRDAPHTRLVNASVPVARVADALTHREIDLVVGIVDPKQYGLRSAVLFRQRYVALSRRDAPVAWHTKRGFTDAPLAVASPTATSHGEITERVERVGLRGNIVVRVRHFSTLPDLVLRGSLVAIVPEMFASMICERNELLTTWPIPIPVPRYDVCMVWHGSLDTDSSQQWLRQRVLQTFATA